MSTNVLIKNLLSKSLYEHSAAQPRLIETHVSWVILTGQYAYKIKKPVDFGFLDFSTLEKRKHFCEEELRLGQQFASEIYLNIVPITGTLDHPQINGTGPILEYAIKMLEFPQENLLSTLLKQGGLTENIIDQLSKLIAEFHKKTPVATKESRFGQPEEVHAPTKQNFEQIAPLLTKAADIEQLKRLELWSEQQFKQFQSLLQSRKDQGFIRDCHGDLHLANIIFYKNKPILFDRLEFNEDLRWTDVIADLAFLMMDLTEKKQIGFSNQLVNTYLHYTEDYEGLALLPYYLAYRAVVRAKIALFRLKEEKLGDAEKKEIQNDYYNFINLAESYTHSAKPSLIITHGFAGSGKTTLAKECVKYCGAIQISSDIIRKNLFDIPLHGRSNSGLNSGIYTAEATKATYKKLSDLAEIIIKAGFTTLVDATFLKHSQRTCFYSLAEKMQIPFYILHCQVNNTEIEQRIKSRLNKPNSVSEADLTILIEQKKNNEPLTSLEKEHTLLIKDKQTLSKSILDKICPHANFDALS
ncbi:AAA family ATPase [Rickettsiella endosymbiont of Dermanyssus gallinae]|uniref:bifunctional aminoglycoside phosphotransferase/ATP-binding protein n=1 Tax=Rickettsiella endosymbiont of Dermanyssus gallinae TaxID=2856608 RepID=UPI001C52F0CA|nr:bifunctional aminoglycoside phosphotransferase/ATP-binding protein [Rickettsiella endosymbiont of Dermanyssus gallinae]